MPFANPPAGAPALPRPVALRWRWALALLIRLPQGLLSRLAGRLAGIRFPGPLQRRLNRGFARAVGIDLAEVDGAPEDYESLGAFFVRRLRPGVRRWPDDPELPASPVDGIVGACGRVERGRLLQAKGLDYTVGELLADPEEAERYTDGWFFTIYLSPRHYHRIHAPLPGTIIGATSVPGRLLPVNEPAVSSLPRLFPRNERLVAHLRSGGGGAALVAVGAFNVGAISAAFDPAWRGEGQSVTNLPGRPGTAQRRYDPGLTVERGDELMAFHLGSTVVLLLDAAAVRGRAPAERLEPGSAILLGAPLLEE